MRNKSQVHGFRAWFQSAMAVVALLLSVTGSGQSQTTVGIGRFAGAVTDSSGARHSGRNGHQ